MLWDHQVKHPRLALLHWLENDGKEVLTCRVFAQTSDALQSGPSDEHAILRILGIWLEKQDCTWGHSDVAHLELITILVNLFLAGPNIRIRLLVHKVGQIHDLAEMELADCVEIILNQIHLLDELGNELYK